MEQGKGGIDLFRQTLEAYHRIALDTSVLIYFLEGSPRYEAYVRHVLREAEAGRFSIVVSVMVELELLVKPLRLANRRSAQTIMEFISGFPNLELVAVSRRIAQRAAEIRAGSRVGVSDAIIVSTAIEAACDAVVGNDLYCARHTADLPYLCLEDFVRPQEDGAGG